MITSLEWNDPTTKSYLTRENAVRAVEKLTAHMDNEHFTIIVTTNNEGRFTPVVLLRESQMIRMMYFARNSIPVVRV